MCLLDSLINFYDGDSTNGDVYCEIRMLDQIHESQPLLGIHTNGKFPIVNPKY